VKKSVWERDKIRGESSMGLARNHQKEVWASVRMNICPYLVSSFEHLLYLFTDVGATKELRALAEGDIEIGKAAVLVVLFETSRADARPALHLRYKLFIYHQVYYAGRKVTGRLLITKTMPV
jgi:hypothetical protein